LFYDFHKFFNSKQTKKVYIKKKKIAKSAQKSKKKLRRKSPCVCEWKNRLQLRFPSRWVCVREFGFFRSAQGENK